MPTALVPEGNDRVWQSDGRAAARPRSALPDDLLDTGIFRSSAVRHRLPR